MFSFPVPSFLECISLHLCRILLIEPCLEPSVGPANKVHQLDTRLQAGGSIPQTPVQCSPAYLQFYCYLGRIMQGGGLQRAAMSHEQQGRTNTTAPPCCLTPAPFASSLLSGPPAFPLPNLRATLAAPLPSCPAASAATTAATAVLLRRQTRPQPASQPASHQAY